LNGAATGARAIRIAAIDALIAMAELSGVAASYLYEIEAGRNPGSSSVLHVPMDTLTQSPDITTAS